MMATPSQVSISKKNIQFDKGTPSTKSAGPNKGIPDKYKNHRKSSIPFADRIPHVRFIKAAEEHSSLDIGSHQPTTKEPDAGKTILKKTTHPILVDVEPPSPEFEDKSNINWQIGDSTSYIERVSQHFSSIEREVRGTLDILTYPVSSSQGIEALARFHCGFAVTIICIEDLLILTARNGRLPQFREYITKIQDSARGLLSNLGDFKGQAKGLQKAVKIRHKQWGKGVLVRGQFHLEQRRLSIVPVYGREMPENVTLFENEDPEGLPGSRPEGKIQFLRTEGDLAVMVETNSAHISRNQEELDEAEIFCLITCLLDHTYELVAAAGMRLGRTEELCKDPIFDEEYSKLKQRLDKFEEDKGLDPLVALDLKGALGELLNRKEELYNTVEHVVKYGEKMRRLVKLFLKYTTTVGIPKRKVCTCGCGRVNCDKLFEAMNIVGMDFMITMPLRESFIKDFCHIDVKNSGESVKGSGDDK